MEEIHLTGFPDMIHNYITSIKKTKEFEDRHYTCIMEMLTNRPLFPTHDVFESRKFVSFLLWAHPDICSIILNSRQWEIDISQFEQELFTSRFNNNTIMLYSIFKFIGQYTTNYYIYKRCIDMCKNISIEMKHVTNPKNMLHLFHFNKYFKLDSSPPPDKHNYCNRMTEFHSGYILNYKEMHYQYRKLRVKLARHYCKEDPTEVNCIYYLECVYYYFNTIDTQDELFTKMAYFIKTRPILKYLRDITRKIIKCSSLLNAPIDEFTGNMTASYIISNYLFLIDHSPRNDNDQELVHVIYRAVSNENKRYNTINSIILMELLKHHFIEPHSDYMNLILKLAKKYNLSDMLKIVDDYKFNVFLANVARNLTMREVTTPCSQIY